MKLLFSLLLFCFLQISCSQKKYPKLNDQSVWTFSRYDETQVDNFRKIKVKFRDNGYAYEQNTILTYPYAVYFERNIFEFDNKRFQILRWEEDEILLRNTSSEIVVVLRRE